MMMGAITQAEAASIIVKTLTVVVTAILLAIRAASWLEKLCVLLERLLGRLTKVAKAFGKIGVAWQRLQAALKEAWDQWRRPPGGPGRCAGSSTVPGAGRPAASPHRRPRNSSPTRALGVHRREREPDPPVVPGGDTPRANKRSAAAVRGVLLGR